MSYIQKIVILVVVLIASFQAQALTGDAKTACEVILCLSSGQRPSECREPLRKYFSISAKRFSDTIKKRKNFLKLCPTDSGEMASLVEVLSHGGGNCTASGLNKALFRSGASQSEQGDKPDYISNRMPHYCKAYTDHAYTVVTLPKYVGIPARGGLWVEEIDYDSALNEYNARIAEEDRERAKNAERE